MGSTDNSLQLSASTETRFRAILLRELESGGVHPERARQLVFRTPDRFHELSGTGDGLTRLNGRREEYRYQLPLNWYYEGIADHGEPDVGTTEAVPTFIVVPGIFGEFIRQLPFEELLGTEVSSFARRWTPVLEREADERHRLQSDGPEHCRLADTLKLGGIVADGRAIANLVVCAPAPGSLETLGSLESNAEIYIRRFSRLFAAIEDDADIYLIGYSRGTAVALEIASMVGRMRGSGEQPGWADRLRGLVGLGGVWYGAQFADDVIEGRAGATSQLLEILVDTARELSTVEDSAPLKDRAAAVARNARTWARFLSAVRSSGSIKPGEGKEFLGSRIDETIAAEARLRLLGRDLPAPSPWGIWSIVGDFFAQTFELSELVGRYNQNVEALKLLVERVVEGVGTLTPAARDAWWRSHELPPDLRLLSITGTMPDAHLAGLRTPLWDFDGYGVRTSDYNVSLRTAFYDTMVSEGTMLNDSQVAHSFARYWPGLYPGHANEHHYLGVLGTHHWGMAFPYAIQDDEKVGPNPFPRAALLRALGTYVSGL